jgi:hypothetical protein
LISRNLPTKKQKQEIKASNELRLEREKNALKLQLEREKQDQLIQFKEREATLNLQLREKEMALEYDLTRQKNEMNAVTGAMKNRTDTNLDPQNV